MLGQKLCDRVRSKGIRHASIVLAPTYYILIRVRPEQIAQKPLVRNINGTLDVLDLVKRLELWRKAPVHAQNLLVDKSTHWKAIKTFGKCFPKANIVPTLALVIKAIDAVD